MGGNGLDREVLPRAFLRLRRAVLFLDFIPSGPTVSTSGSKKRGILEQLLWQNGSNDLLVLLR